MEIKKAIEILSSCRSCMNLVGNECIADGGCFRAKEEAIAALKKQYPQKIILNSEDDREYEDFICPNCKDILQQRRKGATAVTVHHFAYCHVCGQALDWRDIHG